MFHRASQHTYRVYLQTALGDRIVYVKSGSSQQATSTAVAAFQVQYPATKVSKTSAIQVD